LNNFKKKNISSQVATLLILIITAILIFTLIVVNIGQISNYATQISNAADAGSLYLASQLATESFQLSKGLLNVEIRGKKNNNPFKVCERISLFPTIVSTVFSIILVFTLGTAWLASLAVIIIGTAIGAITGKFVGIGWFEGAQQGFVASCGVVGGAELATTGTAMGISAGSIIGIGLGTIMNLYNIYEFEQMRIEARAEAVKLLGGLPAKVRNREAIFLEVLSSTVDDPNKVKDIDDSDRDGDTDELIPNFQACWYRRMIELKKESISPQEKEAEQIVKKFFKGPVSDFENAVDKFLKALWRKEIEVWQAAEEAWKQEEERAKQIKEEIEDIGRQHPPGFPEPIKQEIIGEGRYFSPPLEPFTDGLKEREGSEEIIKEKEKPISPEAFAEKEKPVGLKEALRESIPEGVITSFLRTLKDAGYKVSFWEPGPTCEELEKWKKSNSDEPPPSGYDELDYIIDYLQGFKAEVKALKDQKVENLLKSCWETWVKRFYAKDEDPESADYYHFLSYLIEGGESFSGLEGWKKEIENIRSQLPICIYGNIYRRCPDYSQFNNYYYDKIPPCKDEYIRCDDPCAETCHRDYIQAEEHNPPCRGCSDRYPPFATIDVDFEDEFRLVEGIINEFIEAVENFRQACKDFYSKIDVTMKRNEITHFYSDCGLTGINPIIYSWYDSRCPNKGEKCHSVEVWVSDFNEPCLNIREYGSIWYKKDACLELPESAYHQKVTVKVTRRDPTGINVGAGRISGVLGKWNPFSGVITRSSTAEFRGAADGKGYVKLIRK
jgi:hypothetical protein